MFAALARYKVPHRFAGDQKKAEHIEVELLVEMLGGDGLERHKLVNARVVDKDVDRTERLDGLGDHAFHMVGEKYIDAVRGGSGAIPLLIPVLSPPLAAEDILRCVDGLLLTGSTSNVSPRWYSGPNARRHTLLDEARDATAIPLIRTA